jgi:hypothetical protein
MKKLKLCFSCKKDKVIWKIVDCNRYCKVCYHITFPKVTVKKSYKIKPKSKKREKLDSDYSKRRKIFLEKKPMCEAHIIGICTQMSTDVHHKKGRTGDLYLDESYWLSVCRACHNYIETHPTIAKEMGFSISRLTNNN